MKFDTTSEYINAKILGEHFISEHIFFNIKNGETMCYDGNKTLVFNTGEFGLIRKYRLARYSKKEINNPNETLFIHFDEIFLKNFQKKYKTQTVPFNSEDTFIKLKPNELLHAFFKSLSSYIHQGMLKDPFADVKREELLLI
jgi:hypothetical protein